MQTKEVSGLWGGKSGGYLGKTLQNGTRLAGRQLHEKSGEMGQTEEPACRALSGCALGLGGLGVVVGS